MNQIMLLKHMIRQSIIGDLAVVKKNQGKNHFQLSKQKLNYYMDFIKN